MSEFVPSPAQQALFDWVQVGQGNAIVGAVAGAGKTTSIMRAIRHMQGKVFYGVFNTSMAKEANGKIAQDDFLSTRGNLYCKTFHGAGFGALRYAFPQEGFAQGKGNIDAKKVWNIAQAIVDAGRPDLFPLVPTVAKSVGMAKNRGIGATININDENAWLEMIAKYDLDNDLPDDFNRNDKLVPFCKAVLNKSNADLSVIDFDDMIYLPIQRNLRMLQHDWVLVDECQDTNPMRRELARKLLSPNGRMVCVGDPYQAIFGFTGADTDAFEILYKEFQCTYLPLTVSYRCPKAVVQHANNWVKHIEAHENAPEGSFSKMGVLEFINSVKVGDAVLCRYNKPLVECAFRLIRDGKPAKIQGRDIGEGLCKLAGRWKVANLHVLQEKLEKHLDKKCAQYRKDGKGDKADRLSDQIETLQVLIERVMEQGKRTVLDLQATIRDLFGDGVSNKPVIHLCSQHKAKGLEWERVYILGRNTLQPAKHAKGKEQREQERNLIYVAVTRAKRDLIEVSLDADFDVQEDKQVSGEAA